MEKEFDIEIKEVLSRVETVKAESLDDAICCLLIFHRVFPPFSFNEEGSCSSLYGEKSTPFIYGKYDEGFKERQVKEKKSR